MTREEAITAIRLNIEKQNGTMREAIKTLIPELTESEDERIRKVKLDLEKFNKLQSEIVGATNTLEDLLLEQTKAIPPLPEGWEYVFDYEKAFNEEKKAWEFTVTMIPRQTVKESEDERMLREIKRYIKEQGDKPTGLPNGTVAVSDMIAYLDKQKENPKTADSISLDCTADAKCEDRWHKVGDSLPDNPREVLCKDEAGNYFIGRYYVGEGWEISNYDDEDKPHHLNPPVSKWIDFPSEKQKEQKPILKFKVGDKIHLIDGTSPNYEDDCITIREIGTVNYIGEFKEGYVPIKEQNKWELVKEQKPLEYLDKDKVYAIMTKLTNLSYSQLIPINSNEYKKIDEITGDVRRLLDYPIEQRPAEWSEEDEKRVKQLIYDTEFIKAHYEKIKEKLGERFNDALIKDCDEQIAWLKSLRPSWKPSEELIGYLERLIAFKNPEPEDIKGCESLLEQLKKL